MSELTNSRKLQHLNVITSKPEVDRNKQYFDQIKLKSKSLPEINMADVDPSTTFMEKQLSFPLLISSMTGGDHELITKINHNLAIAAEKAGIAIGVGSQRVSAEHPEVLSSFNLREYAPTTLLFANLGAVQLNLGFDTAACAKLVKSIDADALYLHLNPLQEAIQPEGDTAFAGLAEKIGTVVREIDCPVIVKEIGTGISYEDVKLLVDQGVQYIDVAGSGGTSWSLIEHHRQMEQYSLDFGIAFQDWGTPTPEALQNLKPFRDKINLISSGGVRTGIDIAKSLILGARLAGIARPFLKPAMESSEQVLKYIKSLKQQFLITMFMLGIENVETLIGRDDLIIK